jgi:hypothetical protein
MMTFAPNLPDGNSAWRAQCGNCTKRLGR